MIPRAHDPVVQHPFATLVGDYFKWAGYDVDHLLEYRFMSVGDRLFEHQPKIYVFAADPVEPSLGSEKDPLLQRFYSFANALARDARLRGLPETTSLIIIPDSAPLSEELEGRLKNGFGYRQAVCALLWAQPTTYAMRFSELRRRCEELQKRSDHP